MKGAERLYGGGDSVRGVERFPRVGGDDVIACRGSGGVTEVKVHQPGSPNND